MSQQNPKTKQPKQPTIVSKVSSDTQSEDLQYARQIRRQPFCWQEKRILRFLKQSYRGLERAKMLMLYTVLTWIDSDFNGKPIRWYTKTIATYSGLDRHWVSKGLKKLQELKIIKIRLPARDKVTGKFMEDPETGPAVIFTPEGIDESPQCGIPPCGKTPRKNIIFNENIIKSKTLSHTDIKSKEGEEQCPICGHIGFDRNICAHCHTPRLYEPTDEDVSDILAIVAPSGVVANN